MFRQPPQDRLLRIVHVVDTLGFGGLERVVADLAQAQAVHGHRVSVFAIEDDDASVATAAAGFRAELQRAGIPAPAGGKRGTLDLRVLRRLRQATLGTGADIVHSHNFVPSYYAVLAMSGRSRGTALVNTCHNMGTRLANRRLCWLYRWSLGHTDRVALVGEQVRECLVGDGIVPAARAEVVRNGIPPERLDLPAGARARARSWRSLPTHRYWAAWAGWWR